MAHVLKSNGEASLVKAPKPILNMSKLVQNKALIKENKYSIETFQGSNPQVRDKRILYPTILSTPQKGYSLYPPEPPIQSSQGTQLEINQDVSMVVKTPSINKEGARV